MHINWKQSKSQQTPEQMPNVKFDGKCLITSPKTTCFFPLPCFLQIPLLQCEMSSLIQALVQLSTMEILVPTRSWETQMRELGRMWSFQQSPCSFCSQFHGHLPSIKLFWGLRFYFCFLSLMSSVDFCTFSLWLYFYHLLYSMRVSCREHGGDVMKLESRRAWEWICASKWN